MAKIAKAYRFIFVNGNTLHASDVRRAFSDAYDLVNGNLEIDNFSSISFAEGNIIISDTASWSSTLLMDAIREQTHPGYHSVHVFSTLLNNINIFPGRIMVNGKMNYVNTRITISASDHFLGGGAAVSNCDVLMVLMGAGSSNMITNSDIFLTNINNISASLAWNNDKQGYYPAIASGSKRALFSIKAVVAAGISAAFDCNFLDPPWENQIYKLTTTEFSALGFCDVNTSVYRIYDVKQQSYYYNCRGTFGAVTGAYSIRVSAGPENFYVNKHQQLVDTNFSRTYELYPMGFNSASDVLAHAEYISSNQLVIRIIATAAVGTAYNIEIHKNNSYPDHTVVYYRYGIRG